MICTDCGTNLAEMTVHLPWCPKYSSEESDAIYERHKQEHSEQFTQFLHVFGQAAVERCQTAVELALDAATVDDGEDSLTEEQRNQAIEIGMMGAVVGLTTMMSMLSEQDLLSEDAFVDLAGGSDDDGIV